MNFLGLGRRPKTMATLCEDLLAAVLRLAPSTQADDDVLTGDEVAAAAAAGSVLAELKSVLHGDETTASSVDPAQCDALGAAVVSSDVFDAVALRLAKLPFEARKDAAQIITTLVKRNLGGFAAHVAGHARMLPTFMSGFEDQRVALHCGAVLREGVRHEPIAAALLGADDLIWKFFSVYVHLPNFDIASDAFGVLRDALTRHKQLGALLLVLRRSVADRVHYIATLPHRSPSSLLSSSPSSLQRPNSSRTSTTACSRCTTPSSRPTTT